MVKIRPQRLSALTILILLTGAAVGFAQSSPEVTDALGRVVRLVRPAGRIVSLSPACTEILFALGAADKVVGVTSYCNYPPEALAKPRIGGYSAASLSFERIKLQHPDLVIGDAPAHGGLSAKFAAMKLPFLLLGADSVERVFQNILAVGELAGEKPAALRLVASLRGRIERTSAAVQRVSPETRLRVFWETWDVPLMTAGRFSFIGQLIELAGGKNIFSDLEGEWPTVSPEEVVRRNPQVIMGSDTHADRLTIQAVAGRPGWGRLEAVKSRRVHLLDADLTSRAGPRIAEALELLARSLNPELFR